MNKRNPTGFAVTRIAALLLFSLAVVCAPSFAADAGKTYEAQLAEARRFAAEKSWALARDAYAEAAKLAPDADAKRWCGLWQAQAEWRAAGERNWSARSDFEKKLDTWLAPYRDDEKAGTDNTESTASADKREPREKDEFWLGIMIMRMEANIASSSNRGALWDMRREVLDYYASAEPSEESAGRLMAFVHGMDFFRNSFQSGEENAKVKFAELLGRIASAGVLPQEERAWCALAGLGLKLGEFTLSMRGREGNLGDVAAVEALCKGTRYEAAAGALCFAAEVQGRTILPKPAPSAERGNDIWSGGFAGLLARARKLRAKLPEKPEDYALWSAANSLDGLISVWSSPTLIEYIESSFGTAERVRFSVGTARVRNIKAEVYSYDLPAFHALMELEYDPKKPQGAALLEQVRNVPGVRLAHSMPLFTAPPENKFAWQSAVFELEQPLAPGFYMLVLSGDSDDDGNGETLVRTSSFIVSDVRAAMMTSPETGLDLYVLNKDNGAPVPDAEVRMDSFNESYSGRRSQNDGARIVQSWSGKTDADGRLHLAAASKPGDSTVLVANGHPVISRFLRTFASSYRNNPNFMADLFLDRPLYRPGETVHWKIIARERKEGRFAVCALPGTVSVSLGDGGIELVKNAPVAFNSFGAAHGEFVIPASARPGEASWELKLGGQGVRLNNSFLVDNFTPPATRAKIELASPDTPVAPGQEMTVRFNLQYYSGGGVAGTPVECRMYTNFSENGRDRDPASQAALDECRKWARDLEKRTQQGLTDANGNAEFRVTLHKDLPEGTTVFVRAAATAEGMADVQIYGSFRVSATGVFANPAGKAQPRLVAPLAENTFAFDMVDTAGKPCAPCPRPSPTAKSFRTKQTRPSASCCTTAGKPWFKNPARRILASSPISTPTKGGTSADERRAKKENRLRRKQLSRFYEKCGNRGGSPVPYAPAVAWT